MPVNVMWKVLALSARKSLLYCHCVCEQAQMKRNIHDKMTYIPPGLKSLCWDAFLYPTGTYLDCARMILFAFADLVLDLLTFTQRYSTL